MNLDQYILSRAPALLVPRAGREAAIQKLRERFADETPKFCHFDELEGLLELATFVSVKPGPDDLDVFLLMEDPALLDGANFTRQYFDLIARACLPDKSKGRPRINFRILAITNRGDAKAIRKRLQAIRMDTGGIAVNATHFNPLTETYWSTAGILERMREKRDLINAARRQLEIEEFQISRFRFMESEFNSATLALGIMVGVAGAAPVRMMLPFIGLPESLALLTDLTGGLLAFAISMFASREVPTGRLQGFMTAFGYTGAFFAFQVYLENIDWLLGVSFALNAIGLSAAALLIGDLMERNRLEDAVEFQMEADEE